MINLLVIFFLIQIDIFHSIKTFYSYTSSQNKLDRILSQAIYDLKKGEIPLQANTIKYYNDTKTVWNNSFISNDEYHVILTTSNSKIKKYVVQFKYKKSSNQILDWID
jgi:formylmethanofuran dehydrogenase subunit A